MSRSHLGHIPAIGFTRLYHAIVGPFAMLSVAMLADDSLTADQRRLLLSTAITPQPYLRDAFTSYLAIIERGRLLGS